MYRYAFYLLIVCAYVTRTSDYRTTAYTQYAQQEQRTTYCSTQSQPQAKTYNGGPYATTGYSSQYTPQKTNSASAYSYEASYRSQSQDWPYSRSSNPLFMPSFKKDEAPPKGKSPSYLKRFFYLSGGLLILGGMNLFNPLAHPVLTGLLYLAALVA
ncbi:hypothetical protein QCA50_019559 [Cerrena zonata]|uniref:Uncharacterized protein n=1 Tax=Cerrena zonata TaxID=2478898 RepID=A0AAW0FJB1_9APHY